MRIPLRFADPPEAYLRATRHIDFHAGEVQAIIASLRARAGDDRVAYARDAFEHVRDRVAHSSDIQGRRVTRTASDVARHGEGICYAKSHLLVALLRGAGIPAGLCYQRLTFGETPESGYAVHALVACAPDTRWIRLDARGNKPGVDAQFSLDEERLVFPVRPEMDERDYGVVHADAHPVTARALDAHEDAIEMCTSGLPASLE
jgi:transglutaminase-like putative cysteine protease